MTSCLHDICARLHQRAWCASGSIDVPHIAPIDVGAQAQQVSWAHRGTIKRRRVAILKWVSWRVLMGAGWACLDPGRRSWCCFRSVLVGAAGPIHSGADVGLTSFAVVSRGNSAHNALDSGLAPPVSPPNVRSAGVRRSMSKDSTSKAAERASFSLIKSSRPGSGGLSRSAPSSGLQLRSCLQVSPRGGVARASISPTRRGALG